MARPRVPYALLIAATMLSCSKSNDSGVSCDRDPPLTYGNFGKGFMGKHCAGCHSSLNPDGHRKGAPLGVDLDTYDGVLQWAYRTHARAVGENAGMPPGGGPGPDELLRLEEWLECGVFPAVEAAAEEEQ